MRGRYSPTSTASHLDLEASDRLAAALQCANGTVACPFSRFKFNPALNVQWHYSRVEKGRSDATCNSRRKEPGE